MNKPNNRQNNSMKRGRNQRRRQGGGANPNRALDSNGPDVRIRGTANQIYDKYQGLARDAASSGDRVRAENYLQHAEHYFRLIKSMQPPAPPAQPSETMDADGEQPSIEQPSAEADAQSAPKRSNGAAKEEAPVKADAGEDGDAGTEEKKPRRKRAKRTAKKDADDAPETPEEVVAS
ncbi:MAG: DUF4167 domain-containing protein [Pseudomonadota bacterium]